MVWEVQLWVQPVLENRRGWIPMGRCGPWYYCKTLWIDDWRDIQDRIFSEDIGGMYTRVCFCIEEYYYDEVTWSYIPVDHV